MASFPQAYQPANVKPSPSDKIPGTDYTYQQLSDATNGKDTTGYLDWAARAKANYFIGGNIEFNATTAQEFTDAMRSVPENLPPPNKNQSWSDYAKANDLDPENIQQYFVLGSSNFKQAEATPRSELNYDAETTLFTKIKEGGQKVVDVATGKAATDAEIEAAKSNKEIAQQTLDQQKEIYGETKAEILQANKDLIEYAENKGIEIEALLLSADDEAFATSMQSLREANKLDLQGNKAAADELVKGIDEASAIFDEARENYLPWMEAGQFASTELIDRADELTRQFTLDDFEVDPGYQFRLEQGQDAIVNRASALGVTGNTIKDIVDYSQDVASSEFGAARNRFVDWQRGVTDYYSSIADRGLTATDRITDIDRTRAGLATDKGLVRATEQETKYNLLSDFIQNKGKLTSENILTQGDIKAGTIGRNIQRREGITGTEANQLVGLAGGNVNALANYGVSAQAATTAEGQARADRYNRLTNLGSDVLKNYVFLKTSGAFSSPNQNLVAGPGSKPVQNIFPTAPNNLTTGYQSPYT